MASAEEKATAKEFKIKVEEIARLLDYDVTHDNDNWKPRSWLTRPEQQEEIGITLEDGRLDIYGLYPRGEGNYYVSMNYTYGPEPRKKASITCAFRRTASSIAKDIDRRLIPVYRENLDYVKGVLNDHDKAYAQKNNMIQKVAKELDEEIRPDASGGGGAIYPYKLGIREISTSTSDSLKMEVTLSLEDTLAVIRLLKSRATEKAASQAAGN